MIRQSLLRRKPKSDVAKLFVGILKTDRLGRPTSVMVPGSNAKQYNVFIRRYKPNLITVECQLTTGRGFLRCPGNGPRKNKKQETICYHCRAAVDASAERVNKKTVWCVTQEDAERINLIKKGKIYTVKSRQNSAVAWVVVK